MSFKITSAVIDPATRKRELERSSAGACVTFEGWVRDHNDGEAVQALEYEAHQTIAEKEGTRIVDEALARFAVTAIHCEHRVGKLRDRRLRGVGGRQRRPSRRGVRRLPLRDRRDEGARADLEERALRERRDRLGQLRHQSARLTRRRPILRGYAVCSAVDRVSVQDGSVRSIAASSFGRQARWLVSPF